MYVCMRLCMHAYMPACIYIYVNTIMASLHQIKANKIR